MESQTPWPIFYKSFQNQATPEELDEINTWLAKDVDNLKLLDEVYNIYTISKASPPLLFPNTDDAWKKVNQKTSSRRIFRKSYFIKAWHVAAAIIVFGLLIVGFIEIYRDNSRLSGQYSEVITLPGQRTNIVLPDGTKVWLNSASSIRYSSLFNKKNREIILNGEAFFEVHKDKSKKFRVNAGTLKVDVYGTSFNVRNYPDDNIQSVSVVEGTVGISDDYGEIKRIVKGDQVLLNKKMGRLEYNKENPELVATWKNGELIFRNTPIEEVMKSLENWYGVTISVDKKIIGSHNYTFKIKTESFKDVLNMMQLMTPLEYKINGKDIEIKYLTSKK